MTSHAAHYYPNLGKRLKLLDTLGQSYFNEDPETIRLRQISDVLWRSCYTLENFLNYKQRRLNLANDKASEEQFILETLETVDTFINLVW